MCVCVCVCVLRKWNLPYHFSRYLWWCVLSLQVCAFANESDPDMKGKVLIRLTNITDMQSKFEACMNGEGGVCSRYLSSQHNNF